MNLTAELLKFGISKEITRSFERDSDPALVNYLDFLSNDTDSENEISLDGAIEHDHRPVLYYINHSRLADSPQSRSVEFAKLNRNIASRGERAYLAVVKPGRLEVAPVRLGETEADWSVFDADAEDSINFYSNLIHGKITGQNDDDPDLVFNEMYKLLLTGADQIQRKIGRGDALSLIGRALFFRFLCDRKIITEADTPNICSSASELRACFDNSENAYRTSKWLDQTFNGHFLPFRERGTRKFFEGLNRSKIVFLNLKAIVRGLQPKGKNKFQHRFDWAIFNFAYVPVGLLSQVYEAFSWKWDRQNAEITSVHYTPRNIAVTLVEEAFAALESPQKAQVLDPACGAGVFLVLAFRHLYMEHWRASRTRPNTKIIREILEKQLCGFDISESALRLTALSLYLTAIELDPNPIPPEKLKFKDLNNLILFNHRRDIDANSGAVMGSLEEDINKKFNSQFDLILCNPPWSKIEKNAVATGLDSASKQIVSRRNEELGKLYQNPRGEPDLPFLWKATEWCRPNGHIAMVLPARILFRQGDVATKARLALFKLIRFTGIVNCSNVRKTNVWPDMDQPFMLAFARNEIPVKDSTFWFISPQADVSLNRIGEIRIDSHAAHVLDSLDVIEEPWLLKTLAIGTWLDIDVTRKINNATKYNLKNYWQKHLNLTSRKGYTVEGKTEKKDATLLAGMPDAGIASQISSRFRINQKLCNPFDRKELYRTLIDDKKNDPLIAYRGPILLLRKSLPKDRRLGNALSCYFDIVYNQSFYGYSAYGHHNPKLLIKYLLIFAHSQLWNYFVLCTSPSIATERPVFQKADFDACPIIPFEELTTSDVESVDSLATRLEDKDELVFNEIDLFFGRLFGLTKQDIQVIEDTLSIRNPHDEFGIRASTSVTEAEAKQFCSVLQTALKPFAKRVDLDLRIKTLEDRMGNEAFRFLSVSVDKDPFFKSDKLQQLILHLADQSGASMIIECDNSGLLIGILNQYRYWTQSRARLLAADILRDYFPQLEKITQS